MGGRAVRARGAGAGAGATHPSLLVQRGVVAGRDEQALLQAAALPRVRPRRVRARAAGRRRLALRGSRTVAGRRAARRAVEDALQLRAVLHLELRQLVGGALPPAPRGPVLPPSGPPRHGSRHRGPKRGRPAARVAGARAAGRAQRWLPGPTPSPNDASPALPLPAHARNHRRGVRVGIFIPGPSGPAGLWMEQCANSWA